MTPLVDLGTPPERQREILEARARALARPAAARPDAVLTLVTFALANETYALEARYVFGIRTLTTLTLLPRAPAPVVGLTVWRGALLKVIDLRPVLGLPVEALHDLAWMIAVGDERPAMGLLTGAPRDLMTVAPEDVALPQEGVAPRRDYLRGITADAVLLLDAAALIRDQT
jgi:purine-binding chemotaxis protein CheW